MATVRRVPGPGQQKLQVLLAGLATNKQGKVGWFESAKYEKSGMPVATIAAIQEYGSPTKNIPPRSFMRTTIVEKQEQWRKVALIGAKQILDGHADQGTMLDLLGQVAAGDIAKKITQIQNPPLKAATIAARLRKKSDKKTVGGLTKPLIDSGTLYRTITNIVEDSK